MRCRSARAGWRRSPVALRRPVFQRIGIFTHHPFAGAGGIQQDGVKASGSAAPNTRPSKWVRRRC
jgi:hypothetical protein